MKVVIFAGGFGTRLAEETSVRPKPMVEIGSRPILWHIMKTYAHYGFDDFVVLGGYKVEYIRNWLVNYRHTAHDFTIDLATGEITYLNGRSKPWRVTILDTGLTTQTGGRLRRAREVIGEAPFCLTYGDGVCDVNINDVVALHERSGAWCTVTAVSPGGRFGVLSLDEGSNHVAAFREKSRSDVGLINGGYFVCQPEVFDLIDADDTVWEQQPMQRLVEAGKLAAYRHSGFWHPMDTLSDKTDLERLWAENRAPWKVWED